MNIRHVLVSALILTVCSSAFAQRNQLKVGDAAPGLDIDKWVKGENTTLESGKVYVVEFWATWCVPCRKSIPHLSKLQEEFGTDELVIIGISDEDTKKVEPFVEKQGDNMNYTVAVDRRKSTTRAWFNAAGLKGIPAAFIVDQKSKIAYIGNPLQDDFEEVLRKVIQGRYDPKLQKAAVPALKAARRAVNYSNWRLAHKHYDEVIELDPQIFADVVLEKFEVMIRRDRMNEKDTAYTYVNETVVPKLFTTDSEALFMLAEKIVADPNINDEDRDRDLALQIAMIAQAISRNGATNPKSLDRLASIYFYRGDFDQAVAMQQKAWFMAKPDVKKDYKRDLDAYREAMNRNQKR